jgi:monoamine oxidase
LSDDFDVVVVGGGAAGIGAARRLARARRSVLLLEAGSRLGGRACTQEIAGHELDLGCGWLHSAERNAWAALAAEAGLRIDRTPPAWGRQYRALGFPAADQAAARGAFDAWARRLSAAPPPDDCAASALDPAGAWNTYIEAIVGFISGAPLERLSARDYVAFDEADTDTHWRLPSGYGAVVAASFPAGVSLRLATPVRAVTLEARGVRVATPGGDVRARAALLTVSTAVVAGDSIDLPAGLDAWREAARCLPLGLNEKYFLEVVGDAPFEPDTQVIGDPHGVRTGAYYLRPFGRPLVEAFFGGEGARMVHEEGPAGGFAFAMDQLAALFGTGVRRVLRPLCASCWSRTSRIGGAYSHALPGRASARGALAQPFEQRIFFAGEATSVADYSTAHGAHDSGVRAAAEILEVM